MVLKFRSEGVRLQLDSRVVDHLEQVLLAGGLLLESQMVPRARPYVVVEGVPFHSFILLQFFRFDSGAAGGCRFDPIAQHLLVLGSIDSVLSQRYPHSIDRCRFVGW